MMHWLMGGSPVGWLDYAESALWLSLMLWIAFRARQFSVETTDDFFLASRRVPIAAACIAFIATETSALTIIGVPAVAFRENWNYAQFFIGSAAARIVIAYLFIPAFYRKRYQTIYGFLRERFGPWTQHAASVIFFLTRLMASGVRLMAAAVAVSSFLGLRLAPLLLAMVAASLLYTAWGGVRAVVWSNVLQGIVFVGAGLASLLFIVTHIPGGVGTILSVGRSAGRLDIFRFGPAWGDPGFIKKFFLDPNILWIAVLNGFVGSLAAFGTDHEMMQKLLTVETRGKSQKTMLAATAGSFAVLLLFLSIGSALFVFYQEHQALALPRRLDAVFPHFAAAVMPGPLRALVLSAILLVSFDLPLASLSAVFVNDIYRPLVSNGASEAHYLKVSRAAILVAAVLLAGLAYALSFFDRMLWLAFKVTGVTLGSLLGIYLLGFLTRRHGDRANAVAMGVMTAVNAVILYALERSGLPLGWSWLIVIGTAGTFGLAWALGPWLDAPPRLHPLPLAEREASGNQ